MDAIKKAIENLNKAWEPVAQKMYQAQQEQQTTPETGDAKTEAKSSGDGKEAEVEDADFEVVEEK